MTENINEDFELTCEDKAILCLAFKLLDTLFHTTDTVMLNNEYIDANSVFYLREKLEKVFKTDFE